MYLGRLGFFLFSFVQNMALNVMPMHFWLVEGSLKNGLYLGIKLIAINRRNDKILKNILINAFLKAVITKRKKKLHLF